MNFFKSFLNGGYVESTQPSTVITDTVEASDLSDYLEGAIWLNSIWVKPSERGKGTGSKLLEEFEENARTIGNTKVIGEFTPESSKDASRLRRWYENKGYTLIEVNGIEYVFKEL